MSVLWAEKLMRILKDNKGKKYLEIEIKDLFFVLACFIIAGVLINET